MATSDNLSSFLTTFLARPPSADPVVPTVADEGEKGAPGTLPVRQHPPGLPGEVLSERADLTDGTIVAQVSVAPIALVLLPAFYDAGWGALVDGRPVTSEIVVPALVGVHVGPDEHRARLVARGIPDCSSRFVLVTAALVALVLAKRRSKTRRLERASCRRNHASP